MVHVSLTTRLILVVAASTVLYGLAFQVVPAWRLQTGMRRASAALIDQATAPSTGPALLADCAAHPASFLRFHDHALPRAYGRDGRSLSGEGDTLAADGPLRLALGASPGTRVREPGYWPGREILTTGAPACPLLVAEPLAPMQDPSSQLDLLVLGMLLGIVVVVGTTRVLGVRPLQRRLAELATAADRVGGTEFPHDPVVSAGRPDDLGRVALALSRAHTRICGDASLLQSQREAVERHLADVAHDVRTPVAALSLIVQAWSSDGRSPDAAAALREVAYLGLLLDNLHQESRGRAALSEQRTRLDAEALVERVGERFRRIGEAHGVRVETLVEAPGLELWAHPTGLERALCNLVYNVLLHGQGPVLLRLEAAGPRFRFVVSEAGAGPPERLLRAPEGPRAGALGLGLRITMEVVAAHGWALHAVATESGAELHIEGEI